MMGNACIDSRPEERASSLERQALGRRLAPTQLPLALVGIAMLAGCGGFSHVQKTASLTVVNLSDLPICRVALHPARRARAQSTEAALSRQPRVSVAGDEVSNRLRRDGRIAPDRAHTFPVASGRWKVQLADCAGRTLYAGQIAVHGASRLEFRPVEVQRRPWIGARRFARVR
jgi:hypothetical protein